MPSYTQKDYHTAVMEELGRVEWQEELDFYPDDRTPLKTPALYFAVDSWARADMGTDQLHIEQDCSIWIVVSKGVNHAFGNAELYARELAADISQLVDTNTFGLEIEPGVFQSATLDTLDHGLVGYYVWRVTYSQTIPVGRDPHDFPRAPLKQVYVGVAPKIGTDFKDEYHPMFPEHLPEPK